MTEPIRLTKEILALGVEAGPAHSAGALALVPLFGGPSGDPAYDLCADALAAGTVTIGEKDGGQVPLLVVQNRGERPVLLLDGEHLQGARQDRVLNVSVLAAPMRDTVIPVSCVEHGRWGYGGRVDFAPAPEVSYARLREIKARAVAENVRGGRGYAARQGEVWAEVARKQAEVGVAGSRTGAMRDAYDGRRSSLQATIAAFPSPEPGQTGVVACVSGRPVALDLFAHPGVLERLWSRLVAGYAMDALDRPEAEVDPFVVRGFLSAAAAAEITTHEGVGLGMGVVLTGPSLVGQGLAWEDELVHLGVFASAPMPVPRGPATPSRIESPRRRAQARAWFHGGSARDGQR